MAAKRKQLEQWITERLADADMQADGKPLSMLTIVHMIGQSEEDFHPPIRINQAKPHTGAELAERLREAAETHSHELPGVQFYKVYAFYGDSRVPQGQYPFRLTGHTVSGDGSLATEPPTREGKMMQDMRWSEADRQLIYRQQVLLYEQQNRFIALQGERLDKVSQENRDMLEVFKEMMLEKVQLTHEQRMAEVKAQKDAELQRAMIKAAPAVLHQVSGGRIFPQETADTALLDILADVVTEDQVKAIAASLPDHASGLLVARFTEALKRKKKDDDELKALAADQAEKAKNKALTEGDGNGQAATEELQ